MIIDEANLEREVEAFLKRLSKLVKVLCKGSSTARVKEFEQYQVVDQTVKDLEALGAEVPQELQDLRDSLQATADLVEKCRDARGILYKGLQVQVDLLRPKRRKKKKSRKKVTR